MKTFKSVSDLEQLRNDPLYATVESLVAPVINEYTDYRPEDDGYLVLIEPGDATASWPIWTCRGDCRRCPSRVKPSSSRAPWMTW